MTTQLHRDSVEEIAEIIDWPVDQWAGNCYAVSYSIVEKLGMGTARAVYGHYHGPIATTSIFADRPIVRHGWILTEDGQVIDPTRWAFEDVEPYLHIGELSKEYDEAGDAWRQQFNDQQPTPAFNMNEETFDLPLPEETRQFVERLGLNDTPHSIDGVLLNMRQLFWLGNLSLALLGQHAKPIYEALIAIDNGAIIPLDNQEAVLR